MSKDQNYNSWLAPRLWFGLLFLFCFCHQIIKKFKQPVGGLQHFGIKGRERRLEINDYIKDHKNDFKQIESRNISYVIFNASPTSADSAEVLQQLEQLKEEFTTTTDAKSFIARYGSSIQYHDGYAANSKMQMPEKANIISLSKNAVYGPYLDAASFVMAKMIWHQLL